MRISDWSSDVCSSDLRAGFSAPRHQRSGSEGVRSADNVECQDREGSFGFHPPQTAGQEATSARHSLDGAEGMLDRAAPDRHKIRYLLNPTFHPIERALIHEPVNGALISRRTLLFDLASLGGGRSVTDRPISGMLALGIRSEEHTSELQSLMRTT